MLNNVKSLREAAVTTALESFGQSGAISMRTLAGRLGVSAPALYHHFAGKEQLLQAVGERAFGGFERRLRGAAAGDPATTLASVLREYRAYARDEPHLFGLMFVERLAGVRQFPRDFAAHRSAVFNLLWKAMQDLSGLTPDGSLLLAHDLWAMVHGQVLLWRAGRFEDDATFERMSEDAIERFLERVGR